MPRPYSSNNTFHNTLIKGSLARLQPAWLSRPSDTHVSAEAMPARTVHPRSADNSRTLELLVTITLQEVM